MGSSKTNSVEAGLKLKESLREVALIVLSVLFAFAVEAQWSAQRERSEDASYINGLVAELDSKRSDIEELHSIAVLSIASLDTLAVLRDSAAADTSQAIPRLLWGATSVGGLSLSLVALESLGSSPAWARATSAEFQVVISDFIESVDQLDVVAQGARDYWFREAEPSMRDRVQYDEWEALSSGRGEQVPGDEWADLITDLEFWNLMVHHRWFSESIERRAVAAIAKLDLALRLIRGIEGPS